MCNHNIFFLEDQTIDDFEKSNKLKSIPSSHIDWCPDTFLRSLDNRKATVDDDIHVNHKTKKSTSGI